MKWAREQRHRRQGLRRGRASPPRPSRCSTPYFDEVNKTLAKYETVKQFAILPKDLTVEEGELTPSLKVKRKVVEKKYAATARQDVRGRGRGCVA